MTALLRLLGALFTYMRRLRTLCVRHYLIGRLGQAGRRISIGEDVHLYGAEHINIEDDVVIAHRVTLRAMTAYPWADPPQTFQPRITLKRACFINNGSQISCTNRVTIGENVMIAENCFIADNNHGYTDPDRSVREQALTADGEVVVDADSWIGANCCIAGNVRIGKHCVIGANSVVTRNIPDYSVAAGAPARVLKQYDQQSQAWRSVGDHR